MQAVAHGVVQGGFSSLTGGSFWSGFAAGSLSSIAESAWTGGTNVDADGKSIAGTGWGGAGKYANSGPGMIAFGTVVGGASAELTGGNFWMGAASGFMVSYLNHAMHPMESEGDPPNKYKKYFKGLKDNTGLLKDLYNNYQFGAGTDFNYEASDVDLGGETQRSLGLVNKYTAEINLFQHGNKMQALEFGRIALTRVSSTQFVIEPNEFDFDYQSNASFSRNMGTFVGGAVFGRVFNMPYSLQPNVLFGGSFNVIFNGLITIPK